MYDVAVIGGGAAGLSAALVLSRARRRVLVVDSGTPRNAPAAHMHGYLSRDGSRPQPCSRPDATRSPGMEGRSSPTRSQTSIGPHGGGFRLRLGSGRRVTARRLIVATGLRDELPDVPGLRERWARDVLHCPYCHGWEVRDQRLGVVADGSPESVKYAHIIRQWSDDVALVRPDEHPHRCPTLRAPRAQGPASSRAP